MLPIKFIRAANKAVTLALFSGVSSSLSPTSDHIADADHPDEIVEVYPGGDLPAIAQR